MYPKGTRFSRWVITHEKQKGVVRALICRNVYLPDGISRKERLPIQKYKSIQDNPNELKDLVIRLNEQIPKEVRTKIAVEIKHAFISPELRDNYKAYLKIQIPTYSNAIAEYSYLEKYFLNYFIGIKNLANPLDWFKIHEKDWAEYLNSKECPSSSDAKKSIIRAANRFMVWLHKQRPEEVPSLIFKPISRAKFKEIEAKRELNGEKRERGFIPDKDWEEINKNLTDQLRPFVILAYNFGLRRSETLGLKLTDVRQGFLIVERQLVSFANKKPSYGPLKGREIRRVPYWSLNNKEAYSLINEAQSFLMHPDTLTDLWLDFIVNLNMDYDFHDLRHTWVTKSLREHIARDVQLAAGHKSIETTMKYAHDDRELEERVFIPEGA